jgi:hypothetical protein
MEVVRKFIDFVYIYEYKIPNSPRQGYELIFLFLMEKMKPKFILLCDFCNKHFISNMAWEKGRIFLRVENLDDIAIFHLLQRPLFIQEFIRLVRHPRCVFSKQKSFENIDKIIENFIKMQGSFVPPQCLVLEGNWIKFTIHPLADRQFQKLTAMCYPKYQIRRHEEFLFLFVL